MEELKGTDTIYIPARYDEEGNILSTPYQTTVEAIIKDEQILALQQTMITKEEVGGIVDCFDVVIDNLATVRRVTKNLGEVTTDELYHLQEDMVTLRDTVIKTMNAQ